MIRYMSVMFDGNIVGEKVNQDVTDRDIGC